jgi:hypothetical protein
MASLEWGTKHQQQCYRRCFAGGDSPVKVHRASSRTTYMHTATVYYPTVGHWIIARKEGTLF